MGRVLDGLGLGLGPNEWAAAKGLGSWVTSLDMIKMTWASWLAIGLNGLEFNWPAGINLFGALILFRL
ncbi:hypothetical protein LguiA_026057 [Lonicera macranthoides]